MSEYSKLIEHEAADPIRKGSSLSSASVLYHRGVSHVVVCGGSAERELLGRGALRIGVVTFQRPARVLQSSRVARLGLSDLDGSWGSGRN